MHHHSFVSPGLCADGEVDDLMKKNYGDADVFVCVCNGTSTLEEQVIVHACRSQNYKLLYCIYIST